MSLDDGLFGYAQPRAPRQKSKADDERAARIIYHRRSRRARTEPCGDCVAELAPGQFNNIREAVYIRKHGAEEVLLCFEHKQERADREYLGDGRG